MVSGEYPGIPGNIGLELVRFLTIMACDCLPYLQKIPYIHLSRYSRLIGII